MGSAAMPLRFQQGEHPAAAAPLEGNLSPEGREQQRASSKSARITHSRKLLIEPSDYVNMTREMSIIKKKDSRKYSVFLWGKNVHPARFDPGTCHMLGVRHLPLSHRTDGNYHSWGYARA